MRKHTVLLVALILAALALSACAGATGIQETEDVSLPVTGTEEMSEAEAEPTGPPVLDPTQAIATALPESEEAATEPAATEAPGEGAGRTGSVVYAIVPEETSVTYEVGEVFLNQGNAFNVAVGTTSGVTGDIVVDFDRPQSSSIGPLAVDVSQFRSDSSRRDGAIRDRFLQSAQYPTVTFAPTSIEGLPESIEPGVDYPLTIRGDLTIRETTLPAVFNTTVRLEGETITGQAETTFLMSDFGFGPINILGMIETEDEVRISVDFVARPQ